MAEGGCCLRKGVCGDKGGLQPAQRYVWGQRGAAACAKVCVGTKGAAACAKVCVGTKGAAACAKVCVGTKGGCCLRKLLPGDDNDDGMTPIYKQSVCCLIIETKTEPESLRLLILNLSTLVPLNQNRYMRTRR